MEWLETNPLPDACIRCREEDCYNCEHAGERWYLSQEDELIIRRKMLVRAIERVQRQVKEIEAVLEEIGAKLC